MTDYKESFLQKSNEWLDQPNKMFPEDLLHPPTSPLMVVDRTYHNAGTWFKPTTLEELLSLLKEFSGEDGEKGGGCKIVVGNTEVGIETKFKHSVFPRLISPSQSITSIFTVMECESCLSIGSCVPLSTIQDKCAELVENNNEYGLDRIAKPIHDMLRWFASTQIRNVACLGGNLATASPISDMNPMLACMNASLIIASVGSEGARRRSCCRCGGVQRRQLAELARWPAGRPAGQPAGRSAGRPTGRPAGRSSVGRSFSPNDGKRTIDFLMSS